MDVIARLREARQRALQGEWTFDPDAYGGRHMFEVIGARNVPARKPVVIASVGMHLRIDDMVQAVETAHFIALAANHIDALLDVCEAARAYRAEWNGPNGKAAWNHPMTALARLEDE